MFFCTLAVAGCDGGDPVAARHFALDGGAPPNVLLVIADDVGAVNIGAYGAELGSSPPATPRIDGLAASGVRFTRAWSNPLCSPTRATLYTGRYSTRTDVGYAIAGSTSKVLRLSENTIAEEVATVGYGSALIGKWHLGEKTVIGGSDAPRVAGWDHHAGILGGQLTSYTSWYRYVDGVKDAAPTTTYASDQNVADALAWIDANPTPWIVTVAFNAAHTPYHKPPAGTYSVTLPVGSCTLNTNNKRTCYKAAVEAMDHYTGVLLDGLTSRGLLDSTIVIFVGDNGTPGEVLDAGFNTAHGKGTVYQTGVHVPLVVSGPRVVNPGRVVDALVNTTDLFNTVAELAGGAPTSGTDSVTLLPYLEDVAHPSPRTFAYTEVFTGTTPRNGSAAARDATYKLVESAGVAVGFYDLSTDPDEAVNLWPGACASLATVPAQTACTTLQTIIDGNE